MILHILRKDFRLFWPLIACTVLLRATIAVNGAPLGLYPPPVSEHATGILSVHVLNAIASWAFAFLIVLVVQQDGLVGTRQDWLTRPIARRDMLGAKLLLVLLTVQLPLFGCDIAVALWRGFPASISLAAAAVDAGQNFLVAGLPAMALAVVVENAVQAVVGLLAIAILAMASVPTLGLYGNYEGGSGLAWQRPLFVSLAIIITAIAVLRFQYFGRHTLTARIILVAGVVLALGSLAMSPWRAAFALEQKLSFSQPPEFALAYNSNAARQLHTSDNSPDAPFLQLPLHVEVPAHTLLKVDHSSLHITDQNGKLLYDHGNRFIGFSGTGVENSFMNGMAVRNDSNKVRKLQLSQIFQAPPEIYRKLKAQILRIQLDYYIALFQQGDRTSVPANGANQYLPGYGRCVTHRQADYDNEIGMWCFAEGHAPNCLAVGVTSDGKRNPESLDCYGDYTPAILKMTTPLLEGRQLAIYGFSSLREWQAVRMSDIDSARLVLTRYEPIAHVHRTLITPDLHLDDLIPDIR